MDEKKIKQHPAKLYILVPHKGYKMYGKTVKTMTYLSCQKIKAFEGVLPTKEMLEAHFKIERVKMKIHEEKNIKEGTDEKYIPQPLYLQIQSNIFAAIISEGKRKDHSLQGDALVLTLGGGFPCCVITPQK